MLTALRKKTCEESVTTRETPSMVKAMRSGMSGEWFQEMRRQCGQRFSAGSDGAAGPSTPQWEKGSAGSSRWRATSGPGVFVAVADVQRLWIWRQGAEGPRLPRRTYSSLSGGEVDDGARTLAGERPKHAAPRLGRRPGAPRVSSAGETTSPGPPRIWPRWSSFRNGAGWARSRRCGRNAVARDSNLDGEKEN